MMGVPELPNFNFVTDDSPTCHQSLKHWGVKANELGMLVKDLASSLDTYQLSGGSHSAAGNTLSTSMLTAAKYFTEDPLIENAMNKFSDALNRIECYRDMLLTQTSMLGVEPMKNMIKDFDKMKKCRSRLLKASEALHVTWEKFSSLPHVSHLPEPQQLDRYAHTMLTARQKYQLLLADYVQMIRDNSKHKKILVLQKMLEHMFAEFSFFNYCSQILKDLEPFMNSLFEDVQKLKEESEDALTMDERLKQEIEQVVDLKAQSDRKQFPFGDPTGSSVYGKQFFNKVGGFLSSGVKEMKKYKSGGGDLSPTNKTPEQDWEVIAEPRLETGEDSPRFAHSQFYLSISEEDRPAEIVDGLQEPSSTQQQLGQTSQITAEQTVQQTAEQTVQQTAEQTASQDNGTENTTHGNENQSQQAEDKQTSKQEERRKMLNRLSRPEFMKGYLRIKQKAFPRSKYPLLYFILDKDYGELLAQGQDHKQPSLFARLLLSSIRQCPATETDRNYCFQVITSEREYTLQAQTARECDDWKNAIQDAVAIALRNNPERVRLSVRGSSVKQNQPKQDKSVECLRAAERIKAVEGNNYCSECNAPRPGWASGNLGVVFCIECSGVHRGLGVHISKVKSLSLDKWEESLVEHMEAHGNTRVNKLYEATLNPSKKINKDASQNERLEFIKNKYVKRLYYRLNEEQDKVDNNKEDTQNNEASETDKILGESTDRNESNTLNESNALNESTMCLVKGCQDCKSHRKSETTEPTLEISPHHFQETAESDV